MKIQFNVSVPQSCYILYMIKIVQRMLITQGSLCSVCLMNTFGIHSGLVSLYNISNTGEVIKMFFFIVVVNNIIKAHCSRIKRSMCITGGGGAWNAIRYQTP